MTQLFTHLLYSELFDQISIAALGSIEGLLDYNRIRADMSSLIY